MNELSYFQDVKHLKDPTLTLEWTHTYAEIQQKRCLHSQQLSLEEGVKTLVGLISNLGTVKRKFIVVAFRRLQQ